MLAGLPTYFVRFGGCDYRCGMHTADADGKLISTWCDSAYAVDPVEVREHAEKLTAAEIVDRVRALPAGPRWVTLSGGNPALLDLTDTVTLFHEAEIRVAVETQGSRWRGWLGDVDSLTVSPKPPSSGMADRTKRDLRAFMDKANLARPFEDDDLDALKIVVFDQADLDWAAGVFAAHTDWSHFISCGTDRPGDGEDTATTLSLIASRYRWLCEAVAADPAFSDARVLPQLHRLAWGHARGV